MKDSRLIQVGRLVLRRAAFLLILFVGLLGVMMMFQEKLIFFPEKLDKNYSFEFPYSFKEVFTESFDGKKLHSLYFKKESEDGLILYFHGNAGSLRSWGHTAGDFLKFNYSFLITDFRGYGKSEGRITSEAELYKDADALYREALNLVPENKLILYGRSIGTGVAAYLASKHSPQKVILETPYYSFQDLAQVHYPFVPNFLIKYKIPVANFLKDYGGPIYLIHGTEDVVVPYSQSREIKESRPQIELFTIQGGEHNNLSEFNEFHGALRQIFEGPSPNKKD